MEQDYLEAAKNEMAEYSKNGAAYHYQEASAFALIDIAESLRRLVDFAADKSDSDSLAEAVSIWGTGA